MERKETSSIGKTGEQIAARFLVGLGYTILAQNYWTRFGELDIVARDNDIIVFVEVKAGIKSEVMKPYERINPAKLERCMKACTSYCLKFHYTDAALRFDVVSVELDMNTRHASVQHFKNITA